MIASPLQREENGMAEWGSVHGGGVWLRRIVASVGLAGALLALVLFGCREEIATDIDTNLSPDTYLTGAPPESSVTVYYAHLYWYGNDVDGAIRGYEFAITDSVPADEDTLTYRFTAKTDSIFVLPVGRNQQVLGHRFYVRAIDNEGAVDPTPAYAFFGAVDLVAPRAAFTRVEAWDPVGGSVRTFESGDTIRAGWNVRFAWTGHDGDHVINDAGDSVLVGRVTQYEHWLSPRQASPIPGGLADTTISFDDLESGRFQFNVRAVDDAGFAGLDPEAVAFVWNMDPVTTFETGVEPASGDTLPHYFVSSPAWDGEREFFAGDTIPLMREGFVVAAVDVRVRVDGFDPDDVLGRGVTDFEYRTGAGRWTNLGDGREILLQDQSTSSFKLDARCRDGYLRKDGSPASMLITINRAPTLLDTLGFIGGHPILAYPRLDQPVPLDSLVAWSFVLPVRIKASDPDSTTDTFGYSFRPSGFLYGDEIQPGTGRICETGLTVPNDWRPGQYAIGVRVAERGYSDRIVRQAEFLMPFRIE
jgi:hypothetical protein